MQVEITVLPPVFRLAIFLVLTNPGEVTNYKSFNVLLYAPLDDMFR